MTFTGKVAGVDLNSIRFRAKITGTGVGTTVAPTADTAFGLMLMVTRRFGEGERVIRSQTPWQWGMFYLLGMGLQGKTVGIVGMGQIGVAMARRAKAFGMSVGRPIGMPAILGVLWKAWPGFWKPGSVQLMQA